MEQLDVRILAAADLAAERFEFPSSSTDDASVEVSLEVRNRGDVAAEAFDLKIGLTLDRIIGNADDVIISDELVPGLAAGFSISARVTHTLPPGIPHGRYYAFLAVDPDAGDDNPDNDSIITTGRLFRSGDDSGLMAVLGAGMPIPSGDLTPRRADHTHFGRFTATTRFLRSEFFISNVGEGALDITSVRIEGPGAASFAVKKPPAGVVLPQQSTRLVLRFDPVSAGIHNARVVIASSSPTQPTYEFAVRGRGISTGQVRLTLGDRIIALENETIGQLTRLSDWTGTGAPTFTISNTGPRNVFLAGATVTPYGVPPFYQTNPRFVVVDSPGGYLRRGNARSFHITTDGPSEVGIANVYVYVGGFQPLHVRFVLDD